MLPAVSTMTEPSNISECIKQIIEREAQALIELANRDRSRDEAAVRLILASKGRVIFTGMGKAGLIARKASATFCSTGTPATFLHPAEANHGDLGLVGSDDLLVVLSSSGETEEILTVLPYVRRVGVPILSLTGNVESSVGLQSDVALDVSVSEEADPDSPAPTCSTTCMLAMCDALAIAVMRSRGFTVEQFAIFHPGGFLGRKLLLKVEDLMQHGADLPAVPPDQPLRETVVSMSQKGLGCGFVLDEDKNLLGILTDGDLRRILESHDNPLEYRVSEVMVHSPKTIDKDSLAAEALRIMEENSISVLPVLDEERRCVGAIHIHALIRAGLA